MDQQHAGTRPIEPGVVTDLSQQMSYGAYLDLPTLLSAQQPVSRPEHHDELLFIIQHQTTELWLKLVLHELARRVRRPGAPTTWPRRSRRSRGSSTSRRRSPSSGRCWRRSPRREYARVPRLPGHVVGVPVCQYRAVEFVLGNKNAGMLAVFANDPTRTPLLADVLERPSLYDEFCALPGARGVRRAGRVLDRDVRAAGRRDPELVRWSSTVYEHASEHWDVYEACEELVDLEENFQLWRFRHLQDGQRTIGTKTGTGGSSGVGFLQRALELTFFPELFAVRTRDRPMSDLAARVRDLDASDPLRAHRERFLTGPEDDVVSYLDGNSLGRPLARQRRADRQRSSTRAWGGRLIRGWDEEWFDAAAAWSATSIGAVAWVPRPGRSLSATRRRCCSTSWPAAASTCAPGRDRDRASTPTTSRPTATSLEGIAARARADAALDRGRSDGGVHPEQVAAVVGERTALVLLSHVAYRSALPGRLPRRSPRWRTTPARWCCGTSATRSASVPVELDAWGVDLAVGCTYKYLNGGPGAPAFAYVARRAPGRAAAADPGLDGRRRPVRDGARLRSPPTGIRRFISGTPPVARDAADAGHARR